MKKLIIISAYLLILAGLSNCGPGATLPAGWADENKPVWVDSGTEK